MAEKKSYTRKSKLLEEKEMVEDTEIKVEENVEVPIEKKEEKKEEKKVEEKKESILSVTSKKTFPIDEKIEDIKNSKMPEWQKEKYIQSLLPKEEEKGIPFHIYAKLKGIKPTAAAAMKVYPKAVGIRLATMERWDKLFIGF